MLAQSRILLSLVEGFKHEDSMINSKFLIEKMTNYLKNQRNQEGLYTFNSPNWDMHDEGVASVWALLALIKANSILEQKSILEFVLETTQTMLHKLYDEKTSLVHTKNQSFWCLNSASTLTYFCSLLLELKYDETFNLAMNNSILLCLNNLENDGHFPYSEKWRGTYLLLYHPIVMYTLEECLSSRYLNDNCKAIFRIKIGKSKKIFIKTNG